MDILRCLVCGYWESNPGHFDRGDDDIWHSFVPTKRKDRTQSKAAALRDAKGGA